MGSLVKAGVGFILNKKSNKQKEQIAREANQPVPVNVVTPEGTLTGTDQFKLSLNSDFGLNVHLAQLDQLAGENIDTLQQKFLDRQLTLLQPTIDKINADAEAESARTGRQSSTLAAAQQEARVTQEKLLAAQQELLARQAALAENTAQQNNARANVGLSQNLKAQAEQNLQNLGTLQQNTFGQQKARQQQAIGLAKTNSLNDKFDFLKNVTDILTGSIFPGKQSSSGTQQVQQPSSIGVTGINGPITIPSTASGINTFVPPVPFPIFNNQQFSGIPTFGNFTPTGQSILNSQSVKTATQGLV